MVRARIADALVSAVWFAIVAGLLEGLLFLSFQKLGWLNWSVQVVPVDASILWAAPATNVVVFLAVALLMLATAGWVQRLPWRAACAGTFGFLAAYSALSVSGRLQERATVMLGLGLGVVAARWINHDPERRFAFLRRSLAAIIGLGVLAGVGVVGGRALSERLAIRGLPASAPGAPNILLIVLDTLRADRLSVYGYSRSTTPFLDRLASEGVRFENAISTSSWTLPSHASMFTGLFPYEHGAMLNNPLAEKHPTLSEALAERGYATAGFVSNNGVLSEGFGLARGFHHWENIFFSAYDSARRTTLGRKIKRDFLRRWEFDRRLDRLTAEQVNRGFLEWVEANRDRRFFAFLNFMETHVPHTPPFEVAARFSSTPEAITARQVPFVQRRKPRVPGEDLKHLSDAYDASLAHLDAQLARLFEELQRRSLDSNLLVIITADHGESLGERGIYNHRTSLYSEQIRVPLIFRHTGRAPQGAVVREPVSLRDIPATILKETNANQKSPLPGHSLLALARKETTEISPAVVEVEGTPFEGVPKEWPVAQGWIKSLVTPEWHFILQENGKVELFDWPRKLDGPQIDQSGAAEHRGLVDGFRSRLLALPRASTPKP